MTREEAAELLSVPVTADAGEIRRRYQELYSDYQIRLTNAPTLSLRKAYQQNLQALEEACRLLLAGAPVDVQEYLPAAEPSYLVAASVPPAATAEHEAGSNAKPEPESALARAAEARRVRACPECAEEILADARRCKHCGSAVEPVLDEAEKLIAKERAKISASAARARWLRRLAIVGVAVVALFLLDRSRQEAVQDTPKDGMVSASPIRSAPSEARERAYRLYDRVMRLKSEGKKDSVSLVVQMAITAYQTLPDADPGTRFDMGRLAEMAGAALAARAQADTILAANPSHLLGLILATSSSRAAGDFAAADMYRRRFLSAQASELERNLPEYEEHGGDIRAAIAEFSTSR